MLSARARDPRSHRQAAQEPAREKGAGMGTIGIEWVKKYNGQAGNLSNTKAQAEGFYNRLSATRRFDWGDDLAWDQDFEQRGTVLPTAGTDTTWVDNVDFVFFSGHGSPDRFLFGVKRDHAGEEDRDAVG